MSQFLKINLSLYIHTDHIGSVCLENLSNRVKRVFIVAKAKLVRSSVNSGDWSWSMGRVLWGLRGLRDPSIGVWVPGV